MMLVAVLSLKGSPGVSTFSIALAARWPGPVRRLLVEADPSGGDVATRFSLATAPGLVSLAAATHGGGGRGVVWQHAQVLPGGLAVVAAPPDADRARAALSALTAQASTGVGALRAVADGGDAVVVDCGRIDPGTPAMPLVHAADVLVLLTRAHAEDLAHLVLRLPVVGRWARRPVLLLLGEGYPTADVARELGVAPLGRIPHDPRGAAVLCGRTAGLRPGGPVHSPLGRFAHKVAHVLAAPPPAGEAPTAGQGRARILHAVPDDSPASPPPRRTQTRPAVSRRSAHHPSAFGGDAS
jgi:hypothetical protein